jgi:hypothetical protein
MRFTKLMGFELNLLEHLALHRFTKLMGFGFLSFRGTKGFIHKYGFKKG